MISDIHIIVTSKFAYTHEWVQIIVHAEPIVKLVVTFNYFVHDYFLMSSFCGRTSLALSA